MPFKSIILASFCLLISVASAQAQDNKIPVNEETGLAEYSKVVDVAGTSAELYERAVKWLSEYYPNPNGTIKSKEEGKSITGKSRFKVKVTDKKGNTVSQGYVNYNFAIDFKDNKYRYVINKINWQQSSYFDVSKWEDKTIPRYQSKIYPSYVEQTVTFFDDYLSALTKGVNTPLKKASSDW